LSQDGQSAGMVVAAEDYYLDGRSDLSSRTSQSDTPALYANFGRDHSRRFHTARPALG